MALSKKEGFLAKEDGFLQNLFSQVHEFYPMAQLFSLIKEEFVSTFFLFFRALDYDDLFIVH